MARWEFGESRDGTRSQHAALEVEIWPQYLCSTYQYASPVLLMESKSLCWVLDNA